MPVCPRCEATISGQHCPNCGYQAPQQDGTANTAADGDGQTRRRFIGGAIIAGILALLFLLTDDDGDEGDDGDTIPDGTSAGVPEDDGSESGGTETVIDVETVEEGLVLDVSATLRGDVTTVAENEPVEALFEFRRQNAGGDEWTTTERREVTSPGEYTVELDGLVGETTYEYRSVAEVAENGEAVRETGERREFTTRPEPDEPFWPMPAVDAANTGVTDRIGPLTLETSEPTWTVPETEFRDQLRKQPAVADGIVYIINETGSLHPFDVETGDRIEEFYNGEGQAFAEEVAGSPAADSQYIYHHGSDRVQAFNRESLDFAWIADVDHRPGGNIVVDDGTVFGTDGFDVVFAVDSGSGSLQWEWEHGHDAIDSHAIPAVTEESVWVTVYDQEIEQIPGENTAQSEQTGYLYRLDRSSGSVIDSYRYDADRLSASPTVADSTVYFAQAGGYRVPTGDDSEPVDHDAMIHGIDVESGETTTSFRIRSKTSLSSLGLTVHDGMAYMNSGIIEAYALDATNGGGNEEYPHEVWRHPLDGIDNPLGPVYAHGVVYAAVGNQILAVDERTQTELWETTVDTSFMTGFAVCGGAVFAETVEGNLHRIG